MAKRKRSAFRKRTNTSKILLNNQFGYAPSVKIGNIPHATKQRVVNGVWV